MNGFVYPSRIHRVLTDGRFTPSRLAPSSASDHSPVRRQTLSKLYLDTGTLVWNGNSVTGAEAIQTFLETLPSSEHTITCVDAQAVSSECRDGESLLPPWR